MSLGLSFTSIFNSTFSASPLVVPFKHRVAFVMKHAAALTTFISVVAAIDGYLYITPDCTITGPGGGFGSYLRCNNLRPNTCCGIETIDSPFQSVAIRGIQDGYGVQLIGYDGGNCTTRRAGKRNQGSSLVCIPFLGLQYTGCDYNYGPLKRAIPEGKAGCQRPNALVLSDGTEYDLSGLGEEDFKDIVNIQVQATEPADFHERLQTLTVN